MKSGSLWQLPSETQKAHDIYQVEHDVYMRQVHEERQHLVKDRNGVPSERDVPIVSAVTRRAEADVAEALGEPEAIEMDRRFSSVAWTPGCASVPPPPPSSSVSAGCAPGWTHVGDGQWRRQSIAPARIDDPEESGASLALQQRVLSTTSFGTDGLTGAERASRTMERVRRMATMGDAKR